MGISWALYMLGLYEDIQDRVRAELDEIMDDESLGQRQNYQAGDKVDSRDKGRRDVDDLRAGTAKELKITDVTSEQMRKMKYLDRVIKETLRMWPSIPFVARQMTEDLLVGE